jgi:predicted DNA-binding transcriptional regulator AlpA
LTTDALVGILEHVEGVMSVEYEFLFVVDGVDVDDESSVGIIVDDFDGVLSWSRGVSRLSIASDGDDAVDALHRLLLRLAKEIPGLRVLRLDPDLVGVPDVAERIGHSRQNVTQWVNGERCADRPFPPPEGSVGRSLAWRWAEVDRWLAHLGLSDGMARPTREESLLIDLDVRNGSLAAAG